MKKILKLKLIFFIFLSSSSCGALLWTDRLHPLETDEWRHYFKNSSSVQYKFKDMKIEISGVAIKRTDLLVGGPIIPFIPLPMVLYDGSNNEMWIYLHLEGLEKNINPSKKSVKIYIKDNQKSIYPYKIEIIDVLKSIGISSDEHEFGDLSCYYYFQISLGEMEDFDLIFLETFGTQPIPEVHFKRKKGFEYELRWIN